MTERQKGALIAFAFSALIFAVLYVCGAYLPWTN